MDSMQPATMNSMHRTLIVLLVLATSTACAPTRSALERVWPTGSGPEAAREGSGEASGEPESPPPGSPAEAPPAMKGDSAAWTAALEGDGERIVVSRELKRLWLLDGDSVIMNAPVAVGRDTIFRYEGRAYDFSTPTGEWRVLGKETDPLWVPPDWHYFEKAVEQDLEVVQLSNDQRVQLSDSTAIEVRGAEVGRVNRFGNWWPFTPGSEIIFDGKIFIPPFGSPQRQIPKILGTHRLILGDGYLIHGTPEEDSIGEEASHGCVRMFNRDVERLYGLVGEGTPVFIY